MSTLSPSLNDHKAWLGYLQPDGLVVSAQALLDAGVQIDRAKLAEQQEEFKKFVTNINGDANQELLGIGSFPLLAEMFLGWLPNHLIGDLRHEAIPDELNVALPDFEETLFPNYALRKYKPQKDQSPWSLLIKQLPAGQDLDKPYASNTRGWDASPTKKFERLLRETKVYVGLIGNGAEWRLVYAPAKENSGNLTFKVKDMTEVNGRLILGAFHLLLRSQTVLNAPDKQHLHRLLEISREYQASVSTQLAEQVLAALYELLRGTQIAHDSSKGTLLADELKNNPDKIYEGLLTVLLRTVFLLFAEDRGLMPSGAVYSRNYSVHGLFEKLRADHEKYADLMDQRYGAWARMLALFRVVNQGCKHGELEMPPRHGHLFDPARFAFLEGRQQGQTERPENLPLLSDGVLHRVLTNLLMLDGEKISYRTLDVEEIGSVYQTIMGFGVLISTGTAIALKGKRKNGSVPAAPIIILEELLEQPAKDRSKWLKEKADQSLTGDAEKQLKAATTVDQALAALGKRIDPIATPSPVPKGKLALQPTDERRRSGSHYTPRSFTEPIVRKTLAPILKRLGKNPTVEQILALKIADIAVGSGAFLVEVCRQLAEELVKAWRHHGGRPTLPPDETEELLAMRIIAQTCVYGVDRNQMAVDLAKLSLWLVTLAKNHPFTFLDHALRCGDTLVGLTKRQIEDFTWETKTEKRLLFGEEVRKRTAIALAERKALLNLIGEEISPEEKEKALQKADHELQVVRDIGDAAIAAFFSSEKPKEREPQRTKLADLCSEWLKTKNEEKRPTTELKALRGGEFPINPFHWEIEFPEVFERDNAGFDAIVGNPPFLGGKRVSTSNGDAYLAWLLELHKQASGNSDLVAHFFRRGFNFLRQDGCLGLISTNTISQGDTRTTGLRWICTNDGTIYAAQKRYKWPGQAAVVVSVVWILKGHIAGPYDLDGRKVPIITAYLFHAGGHENPNMLKANEGKSYIGSITLGKGFTFDDRKTDEGANSIADMNRLIEKSPSNAERIFPFIGGEEVNDSPTHSHSRYVINFGSMTEADARKWPELMTIVEQRVKPVRAKLKREVYRNKWWQFAEKQTALYEALKGMPLAIVCPIISNKLSFVMLPTNGVFSHKLCVFPLAGHTAFAALQNRCHESWAFFHSSTMKDDLNYSPTDCFKTFPFPKNYQQNETIESAGWTYYEFRAKLMQDLWQGLTETYNLFHVPDGDTLERLRKLYEKRRSSPDWRTKEGVPTNSKPTMLYPTPEKALEGIKKLRELHAQMDDAVLRAYGWNDLADTAKCDFLLDYEDEDDGDEDGSRQKRKPYRYRWPDEFRDEVLARLLLLNAERAKEEEILGQMADTTPKKKSKINTAVRDTPVFDF